MFLMLALGSVLFYPLHSAFSFPLKPGAGWGWGRSGVCVALSLLFQESPLAEYPTTHTPHVTTSLTLEPFRDSDSTGALGIDQSGYFQASSFPYRESLCLLKIHCPGAGEIAQHLGDPCLIRSTRMGWLTTTCNSSLRDSCLLLATAGNLQTRDTYAYTQVHTDTHKLYLIFIYYLSV